MPSEVKFTINIGGNAYTGIAELDEAMQNLNISAKNTSDAFNMLSNFSFRFENITKSLQNVSNNVQSAIQPGIALNSSLCTDYPVFVYYLYFNSGDVDLSGSGYRICGQSVRPVCPSQN